MNKNRYAFLIGLALININHFLYQDLNSLETGLLLIIDVCCIPLLDNRHKRTLRKLFYTLFAKAHIYLGISRATFVWITRFMALVSAIPFILLAFLNKILNPDFLMIGFFIAAAIYYFWYYHWIIDSTTPIDRRIINCFRKK